MSSDNRASSATMDKPQDNPPSADTPPAANRRTTKIILGVISVVIAAALLAIGVLGFGASIGFRILGGLATALSIAVLLYYALESTVVLFSRAPCLSPAVALSLHLVLGLGAVVVAALLIASTAYVAHWQDSFGQGPDELTGNTPVPGYVANGDHWYRLSIAGCALAVAEALIHLALATLAAIDVHRARRAYAAVQNQPAEADEAAAPAYSPRRSSSSTRDEEAVESGKGDGAYFPEPKSRGI
ncbi:hypothetical protein F4810DRAFT_144857 [Camillea tinctor]|nr:hypothetical protein F4810DRAFT_144857 [Camillea tinctor]